MGGHSNPTINNMSEDTQIEFDGIVAKPDTNWGPIVVVTLLVFVVTNFVSFSGGVKQGQNKHNTTVIGEVNYGNVKSKVLWCSIHERQEIVSE
jgi:hypothetical protein